MSAYGRKFDVMIGELDRLLSEFLIAAESVVNWAYTSSGTFGNEYYTYDRELRGWRRWSPTEKS